MSFLQCFTQKTAFWLVTGNQEFYRLLERLWAWSLFVFPSLDLSIRIGYLYNGLQNLTSIAIISTKYISAGAFSVNNDMPKHRMKSLYRRWKWHMQSTFDMINSELGDADLSSLYDLCCFLILSRSHLGEANQPTKILFKQFMQFSNWKSQLLLHSLFRVSSLLEQSGR